LTKNEKNKIEVISKNFETKKVRVLG